MSQLTRRSILTAALIGLPSLHLARAAEVRKIIVPLPVGTGADSIIRVVAHALGEMTGEILIERSIEFVEKSPKPATLSKPQN